MSRKYVMQEQEDLFKHRKYINEIVHTIATSQFKEIEDINLENLREFLIVILRAFQEKKFTLIDILDIIDVLEIYVHRRYMDEYPETCYPCPSNDQEMSIGLNALDFIKEGVQYGNLLPNIMKPLLEYLQTSHGKEQEANDFMEKYIEELKIKRQEKAQHNLDGSYTYTFDQLEEK